MKSTFGFKADLRRNQEALGSLVYVGKIEVYKVTKRTAIIWVI